MTVETTSPRTGARSVHMNDTSGSSMTFLRRTPTSSNTLVARFGLKINAVPPADVASFALFDVVGAGVPNGQVGYDKVANKFNAGFSGATVQLAATTVALNTWYAIDVRLLTSTGTATLEWAVNGVTQTTASNVQTSALIDQVYWGGWTGSDKYDINLDDLILTNTSADYPIGTGGIYPLAPNSVGVSSNTNGYMQNNDSTAIDSTSWNRVDEVPISGTTDYVKQTAVDANAYINLGFEDITQVACVNAVQGVMAVRASATGANSWKVALWDGGTERVLLSGDMSVTTSLYQATPVAVGSGIWTVAKLNALTARAGNATVMGGQPYLDALLVEADLSF
jgi:hypothetical protein